MLVLVGRAPRECNSVALRRRSVVLLLRGAKRRGNKRQGKRVFAAGRSCGLGGSPAYEDSITVPIDGAGSRPETWSGPVRGRRAAPENAAPHERFRLCIAASIRDRERCTRRR